MPTSEEILYHIWKFKLFNQVNLKTKDDEEIIEIINAGLLNNHSGPDFINAKLKIADTLWAGNVEIHLKSSDWKKHQHHYDEAYDNVILHVVWEHDLPIYRTDGTLIAVLELKDKVEQSIIDKYDYYKNNQNWIPCQHQFKDVDEFLRSQWLHRVLIERLELKSESIARLHQQLKGNWEETFYVLVAKYFGFKVNALPFEMLAKSLPQSVLAKHKDQPLQIEALLFGQAGLLQPSLKDDYPKKLFKEYQFLSAKYNLKPIESTVWKFGGLRPSNFPTVRIAQLSALIIKSTHLFSKIIEAKSIKDFKEFFSELPINNYWSTHYIFDKITLEINPKIGETSINVLLINAVVPMLFNYGKLLDKEILVTKSLELLESIKAENNTIIDGFKSLGYKVSTAFESQALIHLKNNYCDEKKCLDCGIGNAIFKI